MSLQTRVGALEAAAAERAAAEMDRALDAFNSWTMANWTEAEHDLWTRHLLNIPAPDEFYAHLSMTRSEAEKIMAEYAPLTPDEVPVLDAAWARVPPEIEAALMLRPAD